MDDSTKIQSEVNLASLNEALENSTPNQENLVNPIQSVQTSVDGDFESNIKAKSNLARKIFLPILILLILVLCAVLFNFLFLVPRAKARVFVSEMSRGFDLTILDIEKLATNSTSDKNSFEITRGVFFVIPSLRNSLKIENNIAQDINNINVILSRIKTVKDQQSKLAAPLEIQDLNTKIDKYYLAVSDAFNALAEYEIFQVKIIEAQGKEYNAELSKFEEIYKASTRRADVIVYFTKLVNLGGQSIERLNALGKPPGDQINFYRYIVDSDVDRTDSLKKVLTNSSVGKNGDVLSIKVFSDYLKRQDERNKNNIESTKALVERSLLRTFFDKVITQEDVVKEAFSAMKERYGIEQLIGGQSQEATSSTAP